jgi:signal transduction histidine kinase
VELGPLLGIILEQLKGVAEYTGSSILTLDGEELVILDAWGVDAPAEAGIRGLRFPVHRAEVLWDALRKRETVIINDIRDDTVYARDYRAVVGKYLELPGFKYIRSWLGVPLALKDRVIGMISLSHHEPGFYTDYHATLAVAIANHAAAAIETARLFAESEQRSRELEALFRADETLYRSLRLNDVLQALVDVAVDILQADTTSVLVWDALRERLVMGAARGYGDVAMAYLARGLREGITWHVAQSNEPIAVEDACVDARVSRPIVDSEGIRSLLHVPIRVDGTVFGVFGVNYREPRRFTGQEERLLLALAQRAALAIENARLFERAQGKAALEERQRLARELHDSVSQALFSIALGARTARTLLDRDPSQAAPPLDYVLNLAEAGLAEMRALIFELRPESLATEGLVVALEKQAAALQARHTIETDLGLCPEPDAPLVVKEALYRIAQEALHNVVKHARATRVGIQLACEVGGLTLDVYDDGVGFDPDGEFPGHLGLRSMRERVMALGGALEIASAPGQGTHTRACIPIDRETG